MKIQDIIDKFNKLPHGTLGEFNEDVISFCEAEEYLKSSLTSLLDSIEKELPEVTPIKDGSFLEEEVTNYAQMRYRQEVINIINSHK